MPLSPSLWLRPSVPTNNRPRRRLFGTEERKNSFEQPRQCDFPRSTLHDKRRQTTTLRRLFATFDDAERPMATTHDSSRQVTTKNWRVATEDDGEDQRPGITDWEWNIKKRISL